MPLWKSSSAAREALAQAIANVRARTVTNLGRYEFTIGWDSQSADFAMTLGEFYCKGLTAPVMVEIKRDDVVFARVYDIRGSGISTLLAIPAP